ncbi:Xylose isomerase-like TIM barrel [Pseudovibrio axinellae]|uniref:Xylose isomerase-like TIM barrel n=1 Tax=Pseudovibrio axinellae TaxID=989403 RepID=A0A165Z0I4_9HYPH|nr:sugar phosphate isomerase/epimerase [Pseudovibrio axinellae]KZL19402.1 Xylose isomerase-like TIM barrel [Pseudovibrio axinellae]SER58944.1 Sugar phosphate isomerase/epimerase [Pseudovibrio axinellae]
MKSSIQLYCARNFQPWGEVLKTVGGLGYKEVEGFEGCFEDVPALAVSLSDNGLTMPSAHFGIESLETEPGKCFETARALKITFIIAPYLAEEDRPQTKADWITFAHRLARLGDAVKAEGFDFGWHNHDFEFHALEDGTLPMDLILTHAPNIAWEADIAWIAKGGQNPMDWIGKYGDRIRAVHLKDIAPDGQCADEDGWTDLGFGTLPWAALLDAVHTSTNATIMVMEHDNPSDFKRFARRSLTTFEQMESVG